MLLLYTAMIDDEVDQCRFADIYYGYRKQMLVVAQRVLHNPEDAEDAIQTALLGIAQRIHAIPTDNEKVLRAYVLTAAKNAALSMLPKKQERDKIIDIAELTIASNDDLFEQVMASQDYELLLRAMRQLPGHYREVLMLILIQERSGTFWKRTGFPAGWHHGISPAAPTIPRRSRWRSGAVRPLC